MIIAITLLTVHSLEYEAQDEGCNAQAGQHNQRSRVVELCRIVHIRIGLVQNLADKQREEPQTYVLDPEYQSICATDDLLVNQFRNAWPE